MTTAIVLQGAGKSYAHYEHALDRLWEVVTGKRHHREWVALHPLDLEIAYGEVVGLIGLNGAGKSTLLKLVANTLVPSSGHLGVNGRVSALLELGTGFHPEMSGRDNVYLSGAVMGLPVSLIDQLYDEIVAFAGLGEFMDQPVKTYSSGMFARLAFAVATCVEPDILIVDEALSVGDAAFARKSFDRIMRFKKAGKTILFCSHSLYQVEAICSRVIWLHEGRLRGDGEPAEVIAAYNEFLGTPGTPGGDSVPEVEEDQSVPPPILAAPNTARILDVQVGADALTGRHLRVQSGVTEVTITVQFVSDPALPTPVVAITFSGADGRIITSAGSWQDGLAIQRDAQGRGRVKVSFPNFALLKGSYWLNVYLLSEDGVHLYDQTKMAAEIKVRQKGLEQGVVSLPRTWSQPEAVYATGEAVACNGGK